MAAQPRPSNGDTRLTGEILELAGRHDFDLAAVAPVERLPAALRLEEWLSRGMHGTMEWMARNAERRADPARLLPGARSVLIVAMSYWTDDEPAHGGDRGCISRYAWGDEYHQVLGERLEALWGAIRELIPGVEGRWYVDTGPVLEKAWAERAGVGWIGKHTNLISQRLGSWIFLGAVVMDAELAPGEPHADRCGTCRACIDVCPTGALVAPRVLDSRLCISYLTIEHRGPVPRELRPAIGNRVFGCDDCQEACPWNAKAAPAEEAAFWPREGNLLPELSSLAGLSEEAFASKFRGSAVRRTKRRGFVRNVMIALGNSGRPEAVTPLEHGLADAEPLVRGHAAWGLGAIGGHRARAALRRAFETESDGWVREEIDAALRAASGGAR